MKIYRKGSFWFTVLIAVIILVAIVVSFDYNAKARLIPLAICIPTLLLTILILISERYPWLISKFNVSLTDLAKTDTKLKSDSEENNERSSGKGVLVSYAWLCALFILILLVGFIVAIPAFAFLYLKIFWRTGWLKTIAVSLALGVLIYGGFDILMKANLFEGILFGGIVPPL